VHRPARLGTITGMREPSPSGGHRYSYQVFWSADDSEYVASCPQFPSLSFLAPDPVTALSGLVETVNGVVADLNRSGEPVPAAPHPV
jgi:predicted RNase H-like HicB family nuclease